MSCGCGRKKVLIVDDESDVLEFVKAALEDDGYQFITAQDGEAALERVASENPDLVILDVQMPKRDGFSVFNDLRRNEATKAIPVIMLTTTSESGMIEQCYELGCSYYMVKPVDYHYFMQAVQNLGKFLSLEGMRLPSIEHPWHSEIDCQAQGVDGFFDTVCSKDTGISPCYHPTLSGQ